MRAAYVRMMGAWINKFGPLEHNPEYVEPDENAEPTYCARCGSLEVDVGYGMGCNRCCGDPGCPICS